MIKTFKYIKYIALTAFLALCLLNANISHALSNNYQNNLLNIEFKKNSQNTLDINLYSSKEFEIKPKAIKKNGGEYLIILPETFHSITSKPNISQLKDLVEDIDIKLLPYTGIQNNNGYTKILIKPLKSDFHLAINNTVIKQKQDEELTNFISIKEKNAPEKSQNDFEKAVFDQKPALDTNQPETAAKSPIQPVVQKNIKKPTLTKAKKAPVKNTADKLEPKEVVNQDISPDFQIQNQEQPFPFQEEITEENSPKTNTMNFEDVLEEPMMSTVDQLKTLILADKKWQYIALGVIILLILVVIAFFRGIYKIIKKAKAGSVKSKDVVGLNRLKKEKELIQQAKEKSAQNKAEFVSETNDLTDADSEIQNMSSPESSVEKQVDLEESNLEINHFIQDDKLINEDYNMTFSQPFNEQPFNDDSENQVQAPFQSVNSENQNESIESDDTDDLMIEALDELSEFGIKEEDTDDSESFDDIVDEIIVPQNFEEEASFDNVQVQDSEEVSAQEESEQFLQEYDEEPLLETTKLFEHENEEAIKEITDFSTEDPKKDFIDETQFVEQKSEKAEHEEFMEVAKDESVIEKAAFEESNFLNQYSFEGEKSEIYSEYEDQDGYEAQQPQDQLEAVIEEQEEQYSEPVVLSQKEISENKNIYLLEINNEYSLIGTIEEEVFVLHKFKQKPQSENIQLKFNEKRNDEDIYIIQLGKWRALIALSDYSMNYILTL